MSIAEGATQDVQVDALNDEQSSPGTTITSFDSTVDTARTLPRHPANKRIQLKQGD